jgi:thermitase
MNRKKSLLLPLLAVIFTTLLAGQSRAVIPMEKYFDPRINREVDVKAGEILVKFKPGVAASGVSSLHAANGIVRIKQLPHGISKLSALNGRMPPRVADLLAAYLRDPRVEYAEPNFIVRALATTPNDTYYSNQWGLPQISAESAWDVQRGSAEVVIAIIDTGIDKTHADLSGKQTAGSWDFVDNDNDPDDQNGHGTHVAGIAAANTNNSAGVAGVSWNSKLLNLRVLDAYGTGEVADVVEAITYAASHDAKVLNLSLGSLSPMTGCQAAVNYAYSRGCVICAAAGNEYGTVINYPAGCDNVVGVAAVTRTDTHANYSNYNSSVDLCAPGGAATGGINGVYSTYLGNTYTYEAGTSMATPFVAGLTALMMAQYPGWSNDSIVQLMLNSADDLGGAGRDDYYGYGRINANRALTSGRVLPTPTVNSVASPTNVTLATLEGTMTSEANAVLVNGSSTDVTYPTTTSWRKTVSLEAGTNAFLIKARSAAGFESLSAALTVTVEAASFSDSVTGSSIVFPVGSTTVTPSVSATVYSNPAALGPYPVSTTLLGNAVEFTSNVASFSVPVTITLKIPSAGVNPRPYFWNTATGAWSDSGLSVTGKSSSSVSFQSSHLSIFGVFDVSGSLSSIYVYPNPFTRGSSAGVNFSGLIGTEKIAVYSVTGDQVISQDVGGANNWVWGAVNQSGAAVARGMYYYVITQGANRKTGKIAIL